MREVRAEGGGVTAVMENDERLFRIRLCGLWSREFSSSSQLRFVETN